MPQNSNLNVSPYFDDFTPSKNYQKVLFKPGYPIQSRELTTLQSILQNQIEKFGQHFFKEGAMVIPGQISYDSNYTCIEIDDTHLGIPVSTYIEKLVGVKIKGEISGVTAKIENYITNSESDRSNYTLYIKYQSSSDTNFSTNSFVDGENLISLQNIDYGISSILTNNSFATSIISASTSIGSAAKITEGVYFIRGFFITVNPQTVILDQYSNKPSYRVGLNINEEFAVASNKYNDLFDNAQGFSNFAAPGADRLLVDAVLIKKDIDDFSDENFIELLRVENGILQNFVNETDYNLVTNELARRTYDESGDYYVRPFSLSIKESLNDKIGNNGVYPENQKTKQGNVPSNNIGCISISPGKAFVRGYEVDVKGTTIIDFDKPRETEKLFNQSIPFSVGRQIDANNVHGSIISGFSTSSQISFYTNRTLNSGISSGTKIGVARVYDFKLKNSEYLNDSTRYEFSLYDIQTYTKITLGTNITLPSPAFIEGKSSGANGYLAEDVVNSNILTLYQVSGSFKTNEGIKINGIDDGRVISSIRDYDLSDAHQFVGTSGTGSFSADTCLDVGIPLSESSTGFTFTPSGSRNIVTSSNESFFKNLKIGDILSYTKASQSVPTYNSVDEIDIPNKRIYVTPTPSVSNVCDGSVFGSTTSVNDLKKIILSSRNVNNSYFYSQFSKNNVSNLDLTNSNVIVRKSYNVTITSGVGQVLETDPNLFFEIFDEEDYNLSFVNTGNVEPLSNQNTLILDKSISFQNISQNGPAILTASLRKTNLSQKRKNFSRCSSIIVSKSNSRLSGIGSTSLNDGLSFDNRYGLRVQDKQISLNVPDVVNVLGIFESSSTQDPQLPKLFFSSINNNINNFLKGELLIGKDSNAVAYFVSNSGSNEIEIVYANENKFYLGETVTSKESNISGVIGAVSVGDREIKNNFILENGQRPEYYDYSRVTRKKEFNSPTKKIKIIFNHYQIDQSSQGDFVSVDSYDSDRYTSDIPSINGIRNTDIIDLRPRVNPYNISSSLKSPFEYSSREFNSTFNSSSNILAKDRNISLSYSYYLPRIDKIFLSKNGVFIVNKGISSFSPKAPNSVDSSLEIATIYYPAYVYDIKDVKISSSSHRRYTMKDISRLEDRLSNVEYYTSLSLLETDTNNLSIKDPQTNLDKFKCGFFVDNFKSSSSGDISNLQFRCSIDTSSGLLKPQHYSTSLDLLVGTQSLIGIGQSENYSVDIRFADDFGNSNVKRTGDLVSLNYKDVPYTENKFATRTENVNPFNTPSWIGSIDLNPSSDTWIETRRSERVEDTEGNFSAFMSILGTDTNTGISPINWNSWETNWVGSSTVEGPEILRIQGPTRLVSDTSTSDWWGITRTQQFEDTQNIIRQDRIETNRLQSREGIQFGVSERFDSTSLGDRVVSRSVVNFMRSRNIEFVSKRLKPSTRFYGFFDNISVTNFIVPKLLEVEMVSGTFQQGETVIGLIPTSDGLSNSRTIRFRLATQNHKYGPYDSPTEVFSLNPYNPENSLSSSYSATTTILNVDTASLEIQAASEFFGSIVPGMQLVGQSSNAVSRVSDIRLISDNAGTLIGSLFIPDPTLPSNPSFESGTKTFLLSTSSTNSKVTGFSDSLAETNFTSSGTLENVENVTLRIRNANVERNIRREERTVSETEDRLVADTVSTSRFSQTRIQTRWVDPLAETFEVTDPNGVFITKCDIFFRTKDSGNIPVTLQVRTVETGLPSQTILPFSEVVLEPKDIFVSDDSTIPTTFTFESPVYLETGQSYAIVLISNSDEYNVWISRMTEVDVTSINRPESERIIVSQQPTLGSLFKSQNGSTWEPSQLEDLKFKLYRAEFTSESGSIKFYNPVLNVGNRQITSLRANSISFFSKKIKIGLGKSLSSGEYSSLSIGTKLSQNGANNNFSGNLENIIGSIGIGSNLEITNAGYGYSTSAIYNNVPLISISGNGFGATANININPVAIAATITNGGTGYSPGDSLTFDSSSIGGFGYDAIFTVPNTVGIISAFNGFIINNIQGSIDTSGSANEIKFVNTSGISTEIVGGTVISSTNLSSGRQFKVSHNNHGMYSLDDKVKLFNFESDIAPSKIGNDYQINSTDPLKLDSIEQFKNFEGIVVSPSNPGYIIINGEIIQYTGYNETNSTLTGITRGIAIDDYLESGTVSIKTSSHPTGSPAFKYELNGASLLRINKSHNISPNYPIGLDEYYIDIDMSNFSSLVKDRSTDDVGIPALFFKETKTGGNYSSYNVSANSITGPKATQNISYSILRPNVQTLLPETTNIQAKVRTFSGSSVSGNENPFIDQGFEPISLNSNNYFPTQRAILSRVNENTYLDPYPGKKSFTMDLELTTKDTRVSPFIDLDRVSVITSMCRIDKPISNIINDSRVNSIYDDPHSFIYISRLVKLERSADSLKVLFDAYTDNSNEIKVLYRIFRDDSPSSQQTYQLFPGYDNLDSNGNVVDFSNNSGNPDRFVNISNYVFDYKNYEYTIKDLPLFTGYQIKVIVTGTNQASIPSIKNFRAIATI
jgi:hypothetical protein